MTDRERTTCAETVCDATGLESCGNPLPCKEHAKCKECGRERWAHSDHAFNGESLRSVAEELLRIWNSNWQERSKWKEFVAATERLRRVLGEKERT